MPQLIPVPVTVPFPVTLIVSVGLLPPPPGLKAAPTDFVESIVSEQVDEAPAQSPYQPAKLAPESDVAVRVTEVPSLKIATQEPPLSRQLIPGPEIVPGPVTLTLTDQVVACPRAYAPPARQANAPTATTAGSAKHTTRLNRFNRPPLPEGRSVSHSIPLKGE